MPTTQSIISTEKVAEIYTQPFADLIFQAQTTHREYHNPNEVQFATLANIKTGACPEDCNYCSQSSRYDTGLEIEPLMDEKEVLSQASAAKANGSTRFCMGAAWRQAPTNRQFDQVVDIVKKVKEMNMEPCVTLGMLSREQAEALKEAGLHSYNHNIDTSPEYYSEIISTRKFEDRIQTIQNVQAAGIEVCSGGILGLGESRKDRFSFLKELANLDPQPSSVPINVLVPIKGTPQYERLENKVKNEISLAEGVAAEDIAGDHIAAIMSSKLENIDNLVDKFELVRAIATARILMPKSRVRLSAGRLSMSEELQALCFIAGANSIHTGAKLLTTSNPGDSHDHQLTEKLGIKIAELKC